MMADPENRVGEGASAGDEGRSREPQDSILDALDMAEVADIDIEFARPVSHPRPAEFD
ncbi:MULTISPECIES: hypothetical protein [unclassified Sphingomonas]|uniref:hypothetical protein n=1 Tax=unclassified Sphingomonas TaxID=196159 RepID=UPI000A48606D|nr:MULTISPECIES: hypothetical protein [unclassified Sphingomonas]